MSLVRGSLPAPASPAAAAPAAASPAVALLAVALLPLACSRAVGAEPTVQDAREFVARAEAQLTRDSDYLARVSWTQETYITPDTNWILAKVDSETTEDAVRFASEAARFSHVALDPVTSRKLSLLKRALTLAAPTREGAAQELAQINARLEEDFSTARFVWNGRSLTLDEMEDMLRTSRDPREIQALFEGWRAVSGPKMKADYARMVELANEGARELGYADTGALWRSWYDMPPDAFATRMDQLWQQVQPLYSKLHCYVRARLNAKYGDGVQPAKGPIRADLLGNMWGQTWGNIYDLVAPQGLSMGYDLTEALVAHHYDALKIVHTADAWYQSIGLRPEPQTFWQRSQITRPRDREVVCHPSAWDIDSKEDLRLKVCFSVTADDFYTAHHELGHNMYQRAYQDQSELFRDGANDGFHEAIGDFAGLNAVTPSYLKQIGLIDQVPGPQADIPYLLRMALDKVPILAFALIVDKWRWGVFSGAITPERYNEAWWDLVGRYQNLKAPGPRPADAFDPGSKYHIPGNTPYARYFLAGIYQFQFYRAACKIAGYHGPLNRCSVYGNTTVGKRFEAMLAMGASKPWPEALAAFSGEHDIDAAALAEYFAPLGKWLDEQNRSHSCSR
jgi:peptidyl-dipeptidase A